MDFVTPIALVLLGLALIGVEVYAIPGLNVVGIAGGVAIAAGVVMAFLAAGPMGALVVGVGAIAAGGGMFYAMWRSGAWDRFILAADLGRDEMSDAREHDARSRYLGREGVAVTPLRPGGIAEIDGERVEVQTEGAFFAAGSRVRIVAMDRRRFFVRLADEDPGAAVARPGLGGRASA